MRTASRRYRGHRRAIQLGSTWHASAHGHTGSSSKSWRARRWRKQWRKQKGPSRPGCLPATLTRRAQGWVNYGWPAGQSSTAASRGVTWHFQQEAPPIPSQAGPPRRHTSPELPQRPAAPSLQPQCPVRFASSRPRLAGAAVSFQPQRRGPHLPPRGAVQVLVGPCVTMTATGMSSAILCCVGTLPYRIFGL